MDKIKQDILANGIHLFFEYGIKCISMDEIAKKSGVSKKTLYVYFKDKKDLIENSIDWKLNQIKKHFSEINSNLNAIEELFEVNKIVNNIMKEHNFSLEFELKKYYPDLYSKLKKKRNEFIYNNVCNNLNKGIKEGLFREDIKVEIIANFNIIMHQGLCEQNNSIDNNNIDRTIIINQLSTYHLRGIINSKGEEILKKILTKNKTNEQN